MAKSIEEKYIQLSEIEHVRKRPGMYIGSVTATKEEKSVFIDDEIKHVNVTYVPGFLKLFDEIISNSVDEHKRNSSLDKIQVTFDFDNNEIAVFDNGGIPVQMHKDANLYVPEFIFTNLRAGSNFNDDEKRTGAGTHGVGAVLTNIFSKRFQIKTADGKNQFLQVFENALSKKGKPKITKSSLNFTEIKYIPDFEYFKIKGLGTASYELMKKRMIDIAACNPKLTLECIKIKDGNKTKDRFKFTRFKDYCDLYVNDDELIYEETKDWKIGLTISKDGFRQKSFVNSVDTKDGGTHVDYIINQITDWLREKIKKKYKYDVKPSQLRNHMFLFVNSTVYNSSFHDQTKVKLQTHQNDFGTSHTVSDSFMTKVFKSEIVSSILDWVEQKKRNDEKAELRKIQKKIQKKKVVKLIDANSKTNRRKCILGIFEGDSAKSAVRSYRDPQIFAAYPLRGKFMNVREKTNLKVAGNEEVKGLMSAINLKMGEKPTDLRYGKILIYTDADPDGDGISGLLINFFGKYWPELFDMGMIYRVMSPLVVASKGNKKEFFYTNKEFNEWLSKNRNGQGWQMDYKKGLASLEDDEYEVIIKNPKCVRIKKDSHANDTLESWFGGSSDDRKEKILEMQASKYE
jgi:DNA topoisomerase-2